MDHEYRCHGVGSVWVFSDPLADWRQVNVTDQRPAIDWANQRRGLLDEHDAEAERVTVVLDNLNTHRLASFYEAFEPAKIPLLEDSAVTPY